MKIGELKYLLEQYPEDWEIQLWKGYCYETSSDYFYEVSDIKEIIEEENHD